MAKVNKTKPAVCTACGKQIEIHIYASAAKAKCSDCRHGARAPSDTAEPAPREYRVGQYEPGPRVDGKPNRALQRLACPYHPDSPMRIIGVIKSDWGDVVSLQCRKPGCWCVVQISEQSKRIGPLRTKVHGDGFEQDIDGVLAALHEEGGLARWKRKATEV